MMQEKKEEREVDKIVSDCGHKNMTGPRLKPGMLEFWCTDCGYIAQCELSAGTPETGVKLEVPKQEIGSVDESIDLEEPN